MDDEAVDPHAAMEDVTDEAGFIEFLGVLSRDRALADVAERNAPSSPYGPDARGWEQASIAGFLEAAAACAAAHPGKAERDGENPWKTCARILLSGKYYE